MLDDPAREGAVALSPVGRATHRHGRSTMDIEQQVIRLASTRLQAGVWPHEHGYEWSVTEFDYGSRRWVVIDSGDTRHWAEALSDLAMALSVLAEGAF